MKLNIERPNIELSDGLDGSFFSVADLGMIFDILRNKMYSNPILAICREISCNARDTHRVVGKQDVPVEITLPNTLEPFYKIKDFGEGISPERIESIYVKYTSSTKRNDNLQTGAFGIGSKTPFSYSDQFSIETIYDGIKYNYACVIDETKVGKLVKLSSEPTDQPNGTEIIIPVKSQDFKAFKAGTEFTTRHWDVKPVIRGDKFEYPEFNFTLSGDKWAIDKNSGNSDYYKRDLKLIIDGIEYPVDLNQLKGYANTNVLDAVYGVIYLYFGIGELSLSASREAVHLDKPTQDKISERLAVMAKALKDNVLTKIAACTNLWEANVFYHSHIAKTFANHSFLGTLQWNGYDLCRNNYVYIEPMIYEFSRGKYSRRGSNPAKIYRSSSRTLRFVEKSALYLNDLDIKEPTVKQVEVAFTNDPSLEFLQVISLGDTKTYAADNTLVPMTWDDLNKKHHIDQMAPKKLSEITKATRSRKNKGARLLIFKFDRTAHTFKQTSYSAMEDDSNDKVLCKLQRDEWNGTRTAILDNGGLLTDNILKSLIELNNNISIYGIDKSVSKDKIDDNFENFTTIEDFIDKNIVDNKAVNYAELKYLEKEHYYLKGTSSLEKEFIKLISDQNSVYLKSLKNMDELKETWSKYSGLLHIYEVLKGKISDQDVKKWLANNNEKNVQLLQDKVQKKYPLIKHIDNYYYDRLVEPLAHYINLIDKEKNN